MKLTLFMCQIRGPGRGNMSATAIATGNLEVVSPESARGQTDFDCDMPREVNQSQTVDPCTQQAQVHQEPTAADDGVQGSVPEIPVNDVGFLLCSFWPYL